MKTEQIITLLFLSLFTITGIAKVTSLEAESFSQITTIVTEKSQQYGSKNTLIVFDIDNTLLTSNVDLGGDIWYQWQSQKLPVTPTREQIVPCLYEDAIGLLYKLGTMKPTERQVPSLIIHWQQGGHDVIALTARAPNVRPATERALTRHGIDFTPSAVGHEGTNAPVYQNMLTLSDQTREMSYMKGIMMTTGLNKGEALKYLIKRTGEDYRAIVFVDDSINNITNMTDSYKNIDKVDLTAIHYTYIEQQRIKQFGALLTQQQADSMATQWKELDQQLNDIFPGRINGGKCLN